MTREEFVKKWEAAVSGMALCGLASELKDGPIARGSRALDIPDDVRKLLARLYDDATRGMEPARPLTETTPPRLANGTNGHTPAKRA